MGLLSKGLKVGAAKKVFDEARKPQNQRKIKSFVSSVTGGKKRGGADGAAPGRR